jgi:hypothetical protein
VDVAIFGGAGTIFTGGLTTFSGVEVFGVEVATGIVVVAVSLGFCGTIAGGTTETADGAVAGA